MGGGESLLQEIDTPFQPVTGDLVSVASKRRPAPGRRTGDLVSVASKRRPAPGRRCVKWAWVTRKATTQPCDKIAVATAPGVLHQIYTLKAYAMAARKRIAGLNTSRDKRAPTMLIKFLLKF